MSRRAPDTNVEDRLRATLIAEAERHPVRPDLDALRTGSDAAIVEVRRRPDRARILTAAAILIVVAIGVVGALAVVRASGDVSDDDGQPVASGAGASGYHLPGPGWSIVGVEVSGALSSGWTREVLFVPPTALDDDNTTRLFVNVVPVTSLTGATDRWEEAGATQLDRNPGDHPVWTVAQSAEDAGAEATSRLLMPGEGEVLVLSSTGVPLEALLDLADRWRNSNGRQIALDAGSGLERWSDQTRPEATPVDPGPLAGGEPDPGPTLEPLVVVTVESSEGVRAAYLLAATGTRGRPTGVGDADGGISRGIEPEDGSQLVDGLRTDGEVWSVPGPQGPDALLALAPGVDIFVTANGPEPATEPADEDDLRDLMAGLRPVDGATWTAAVTAFPAGVEWTDRLANLGLPDRLADPDRDDPPPPPTTGPSTSTPGG
ncbi:hypothetical protein PO878_14725 [Iamia majanohamensis]|uniref:Uncharacterized protein n=1 Tax=Iamia majanohamensis TaxID=467976 RepID=A0AAE9YDE3_9ACTN|nr:hypothetical protein [Iamia majanohamensis]WCO65756.1 hypothetical protein PO878_14725 [Iamia majanohamensis]